MNILTWPNVPAKGQGAKSRFPFNLTAVEEFEIWIVRNSRWLAAGIIVAAFVLRLYYCNSCYMNPDEAMHFGGAAQTSWAETWRAAFLFTHPPLFILVLHGFLLFAQNEFAVRLPSLLAGTVALWLAFAWLRRSLGEIPALAGLCFLAISTAAISAATEVRSYGVFLAFLCGSLYATERIFAGHSLFWTIVQALLLLGALLTDYSAVIALASIGFYVLLRLVLEHARWSLLLLWGVFQVGLATALCWLYFWHVRGQIPFGPGASMSYLQQFYFQPGRESHAHYAWRAIFETFAYLAGSRRFGILLALPFLAGLTALLVRPVAVPRLMAILIVSPFIVGFVASLFYIFPFAGSRHQTYLLPFVAAAIAAAFTLLKPGRVALPFLLGIGLTSLYVLALFWIPQRLAPDNNPVVVPARNMGAAIEYIRRVVPAGGTIYADYESGLVLRYYLAQNRRDLVLACSGSLAEEWLGGYRVVIPKKFLWQSGSSQATKFAGVALMSAWVQSQFVPGRLTTFDPGQVIELVTKSAQELGGPGGYPLWVFSDSAGAWSEASLGSRLPPGKDYEAREFGKISVIKLLPQKP